MLSEPGENQAKYIGKTITDAEMDGNSLKITFDDDVLIELSDDGQSCCEHRYMTCDDNPKDLIGSKLLSISEKEGRHLPEDEDRYGKHEIVFLEVQTDKTSIQLATHNEHNGYYGGFSLNIREI